MTRWVSLLCALGTLTQLAAKCVGLGLEGNYKCKRPIASFPGFQPFGPLFILQAMINP